METYITQIQNAFAQYLATRPILELCEGAERQLGVRVSKRWWEQEDINLGGEQVAAEAAKAADMETEETDVTEEGPDLLY